jgi:anti-sigma-K factor RskA
MSVHEQFAENLSLYALGILPDEERPVVETHLRECADCRRELEQLRGDSALLAFSVSGPQPPLRSRKRLMAAIAKEPRLSQILQPKRSRWWRPLQLITGIAAAAIIMMSLRQNADLRHRIAGLEAYSISQQQQLLEAKDLVASLTSSEAEHFTLVASKTPPQPQGKAIYVRKSGTLVFLANNMPQLPPQKIYELWLIPASGPPIPAGLFRPQRDGTATVIKPPLPSGVEAKAFAITVEPEAGSPAPTSQPIMVGGA